MNTAPNTTASGIPWEAFLACLCGAISGQACFRWPYTGEQMQMPHTGRDLVDTSPPEPGPIWTSGTAPAAVVCPTWCTRHEHGSSTTEPHTIELLNLAVLADDLITDVPLQVYVAQDLEAGSRPLAHLEIGHALYQPTSVLLSASDRARLAAALLTANHLIGDAR
jgi:hypothetical protein